MKKVRTYALKIQMNFFDAIFNPEKEFDWTFAANRFEIGNSFAHTTNGGGRNIVIEGRRQMDDSLLWVVKMESWVLGKDGKYHFEPLPSSRTDKFIKNTRYSSKEQALNDLIKYEKVNNGKNKPLFIR